MYYFGNQNSPLGVEGGTHSIGPLNQDGIVGIADESCCGKPSKKIKRRVTSRGFPGLSSGLSFLRSLSLPTSHFAFIVARPCVVSYEQLYFR